jgi:hypothetical protein
VHPVYFDDLDDKAVCPTDTETKEYKYNVWDPASTENRW